MIRPEQSAAIVATSSRCRAISRLAAASPLSVLSAVDPTRSVNARLSNLDVCVFSVMKPRFAVRRTPSIGALPKIPNRHDSGILHYSYPKINAPSEFTCQVHKDRASNSPIGCDADPFLTFDLYNTNTIPQTVLIDKQGILRYYKVDGRILELIKDLRRR